MGLMVLRGGAKLSSAAWGWLAAEVDHGRHISSGGRIVGFAVLSIKESCESDWGQWLGGRIYTTSMGLAIVGCQRHLRFVALLHQGLRVLSVEALAQGLSDEIRQRTGASEQGCWALAYRLSHEVQRVCQASRRIQTSGEVTTWAQNLGRHRLDQCLHYYHLGSRQGRIDLHSRLSAMVYRHITPSQGTSFQGQISYAARLSLIEDFLQGFYVEALNAFRRENQLTERYQPRLRLELAEFMAFTERYGKRRIPLPGHRSQQIIVLRAQTFARQQPPELAVDIAQVMDYGGEAEDSRHPAAAQQRIREEWLTQGDSLAEPSLRDEVIEALITYLRERNQADCADYFVLRLLDLPTQDIEALLKITPRQRDYLQQRFKYHLLRFALSHHWQLVHEWLGVGLETNLGLTPPQWQQWQQTLSPQQVELLRLKQAGVADGAAAHQLGLSNIQFHKQWTNLLAQAWEIRNL